MANSKEVWAILNEELLNPVGREITILRENYIPVLGVNWALKTDIFFFTKFLGSAEESTKGKKVYKKKSFDTDNFGIERYRWVLDPCWLSFQKTRKNGNLGKEYTDKIKVMTIKNLKKFLGIEFLIFKPCASFQKLT